MATKQNGHWSPNTNWVDNHQMIITAKYGSHHYSGYGENVVQPFSLYKSVGPFCCDGNNFQNQEADHHNFNFFG